MRWTRSSVGIAMILLLGAVVWGGATVESAQADLDVIVARLQEADPARWGLGAAVTGLRDQIAGRASEWIAVVWRTVEPPFVRVCPRRCYRTPVGAGGDRGSAALSR